MIVWVVNLSATLDPFSMAVQIHCEHAFHARALRRCSQMRSTVCASMSTESVRGSYSARVPRSSLARVRRVLVSHIMEEEGEDQEDEDDKREQGQQEVEGRIAENQNNHIMNA